MEESKHDQDATLSAGQDATPSADGVMDGITVNRRRMLAGSLAAGAVAAAGPILAASPAVAAVGGLRKASSAATGKRVAVLGGGMGGLTVAHELAERGFQVTVYERKALGGKCRSIPVTGTGTGGRKDLPGEHGFRFFPGFYQNVPDSMSRIPLAGGGTAKNNFTEGSEEVAAYNGKTLTLPAKGSIIGTLTPASLLAFLQTAVKVVTDVPAGEVAFFLEKMIVFATSGPKRRLGQWEKLSFAQYVKSASMSKSYRELLVNLFTGTLVAAKADKANARTMGLMAEAWVYATLGLGPYSAPDRVLNAPTNEALIDPWVTYLTSLGVTFNVGQTVTSLQMSGGKISGATLTDTSGAQTSIDADYYVLAVPVERAVPLLNSQILAADPSLTSLAGLSTDWMNGIMMYLKKPLNISDGHVAYVAQPWALSSINQAHFWKKINFAGTYGDGTVQDCLSIDLSAWDVPGILYNKAAKDCTPDQIINEIKAQLRKALPNGSTLLPDSLIASTFIDPAISNPGTSAVANDEPLLINTPGSWNLRPQATTKIPNLFIASDYVQNSINLATMEGANEAGRHAANAILDASGSSEKKAKIFELFQPDAFQGIYDNDDKRYAAGKANVFDVLDPYKP